MVNARHKGRAARHPRSYTWAGEMASTWCMRDQHYLCTGGMRRDGQNTGKSEPCGCGCHKQSKVPA
jgi:hypothetical protein